MRHTIVFTTALILGSTLPMTTQATPVDWDFTVTVDSGVLNGQNFNGSLQYDDAGITGFGDESADLTAFSFTFNGNGYGLGDDPGTPAADFADGAFVGFLYVATTPDSFSFDSGLFFGDIVDASFGYDTPTPAGTGFLDFTLVPPGTAPLPPTWLLFGMAGLIGAAWRGRKAN